MPPLAGACLCVVTLLGGIVFVVFAAVLAEQFAQFGVPVDGAAIVLRLGSVRVVLCAVLRVTCDGSSVIRSGPRNA